MTALNEDRKLLGRFLGELVNVKPPTIPQKLMVLEQQFPGESEPLEEELERRGIPDGWIFDEEGWCVFIESKVLASLSTDQIRRHRRTAKRRGFRSIIAVAIVPHPPRSSPADTVLLEWRNVYAWLRRQELDSTWAARAADYLEHAEATLIDSEQLVEGTLTTFAGFPFGHERPFTYLEGKRVLGLAMEKLRDRRDLRNRLNMNPKVQGRSAITGRHSDGVWDFLSLSTAKDAGSFTKYPHLTLGVGSHAVEAMVTIPNAVNNVMRRNLKQLGEAAFQDLARDVIGNLKPLLRDCKGATPWFRGVQRRYPSQRAAPYIDAEIEFDLRTAVPSLKGPKMRPRWLSSGYAAFVNKEGSNFQIQMGVIFRYERCPELRQAEAIQMIAQAWLGCKPLVDLSQ